MAIFKCKMCGGSLEIAEGMTVCECEYCGTQQTLPKNHDDVLANNFNRANNLRMKSEFDKAQEIYEKIVGNNPNESEAYWGIVLCKYGIEYVEDPATLKKIPTCHRTQLESVMTDVDYLSAIENADTLQRSVYEREAAAIDKLQKDILAIVHKEQPFDVFICYKESDENGKRTPDSVIANDIYHQLTQEGFKVFYAAITLEDKLGQEYEPYIFAALSSAKVMLCIGTRPEYFNAVWVKNEWSRYLKLMKSDRSKLLIPCYKDMDAYDLPEEFSHLQAQDMGKIGFINDVIRGIKKVIDNDEPKQQTVVKETVVQTASSTTEPLLKRASLFLEDGDWASATEYCNKVLDIDPACAQAYFYMLLAELQLPSQKILEISDYENGISDSKHFKSAIRFADGEYKAYLEELNRQTIYNFAEKALKKADDRRKCMAAKAVYEKISSFKDSAEKIKQCDEKANEIDYANALSEMQHAAGEKGYNSALAKFTKLGEYKDSAEKVNECREKARESVKAAKYAEANKLYNSVEVELTNQLDKLSKAKGIFEEIHGFRDSEEMIEKCAEKIKEINEKIEAEKKAVAKKARKAKIIAAVAVIAVCVVAGSVALTTKVIIPTIKYNKAVALLEDKKYDEAAKTFENLNGYKDSEDKVNESKYQKAAALVAEKKYDEAISVFTELGEYEDSAQRIDEIMTEILKNSLYEQISSSGNNDVIEFGKYDWYIISKTDTEVTLLFKNTVCEQKYFKIYAGVKWEDSIIREWLNNEFYDDFTSSEKAIIMRKKCTNSNNSDYGTLGGIDTEDYIYLLSIDEAKALNDSVLSCGKWWWLRSPGIDQDYAAGVDEEGNITTRGKNVNSKSGVRPALTISLEG